MKLNYNTTDIVVRPLSRTQLEIIADTIFDINRLAGWGRVHKIKVTHVAGKRISGDVVREFAASETESWQESHRFTIRGRVLRFIGSQRTIYL